MYDKIICSLISNDGILILSPNRGFYYNFSKRFNGLNKLCNVNQSILESLHDISVRKDVVKLTKKQKIKKL